ncbi:uncharacterized protein CELE_ZC334.13 [Caenorhabditis elegans]|uniref:Uncharacterized protein n=1 Tax=Caenorhabditis elegans TaxID=6239 RepID=B5BM43_CAEEL|nr:Uncharacterized protein CELE_ZC334.13 [Caenorhabditis elegans]CAR31508.1 Uncharacterized protein CELE_ZC334.13 [Caenorhabditis elegans]|eukprot:NP_001129802.1 Uncharacterized protein CELE_ZC334.13 [Caenorhabditis elegans]
MQKFLIFLFVIFFGVAANVEPTVQECNAFFTNRIVQACPEGGCRVRDDFVRNQCNMMKKEDWYSKCCDAYGVAL